MYVVGWDGIWSEPIWVVTTHNHRGTRMCPAIAKSPFLIFRGAHIAAVVACSRPTFIAMTSFPITTQQMFGSEDAELLV
ncbi:hypothetical protein CLOM_g22788 [Closterium sp. NIES-68]|nr:hypothetical protein CLOM_g22788 [Closterium sp. NIES-68]GJP76523.1 hypothetical protein CLOP_g6955 [Closterium sp. NIES-67]